MPLGQVASELAAQYGDRPALDQEDVGGLTFAGLSTLVDERAAGLVAAGMQAGTPVLVSLRNGVPLLTGILSVARAGAIPVPVNPQLRSTEVAGVMAETGARSLVVDAVTEGSAPSGTTVLDFEWLPDGPLPAMPGAARGDVAAIFSTSGTTGRAKAAELTHRGLLSMPLSALLTGGVVEWSVLEALPVAHIMGFQALVSGLAAGLHVHCVERFHPVRFLEDAAALHPEVIVAVPAMYRMLLEAHDGPDPSEALSSVRVFACGSDVLPAAVARRLRRLGAPGAVVVEGYGMVELSGAASMRVHVPVLGPIPPGDLGIPVPPYRVRIVDDRGRPVLLPFRVGHLEVRGPGVLAGYRNRPDATAEAIHGGWLRTGDLASWTPFGLRFAGRQRDVVKVGGYSVYPREVEEELRACPAVGDVAVLGLPDPVKGEVIVAAVEPAAGAEIAVDELEAFAATELAAYRRPSRFLVVAELPRNPNGKVIKEQVKELFGGGLGGLRSRTPAKPTKAAP